MDSPLPPHLAALIAPALLLRIPGCEAGQAPVEIGELQGGGRLNRCLRVVTRAGRFVIRMRISAAPRPGADGGQELACQRVAAAAGLAPRVIDCSADARWVVMEYVEGRMWDRGDLAERASVAALGARLAALHALGPPALPALDPMRIVRQQIAVIRGQNPAARDALQALLVAADHYAEECRQAGEGAVLNHGDLSVANLLGSKPMLVDWEYAQIADPLYDLACLVTYYPELRAHLDWLLGPAELDDPRHRRALEARVGLFGVLNTLWDQAQGAAHGNAAGLVGGRSAE